VNGPARDRWELWAADSGHDLSFFPVGNESARRLLRPDANLVWTVEADSYDDAMTKYYEHMGWAPYRPTN
jgi:hypothetical protein